MRTVSGGMGSKGRENDVLWDMLLIAATALLCIMCGCGRPTTTSEQAVPATSGGAVEDVSDRSDKSAPSDRSEASQAASEAPVEGDWLISELSAEMEHLNPFTSTDVYSASINGLVFDTLVELDNRTLEVIPRLAVSWDISEDKLNYTFRLREGVTFSDGMPLTARDVKFSFDKVKDPKTDAPHMRNYLDDVTSCEVVDEATVRFTCAKPYFRHLIVLGLMEVIPEHVYGQGDFNNHPNNRNPIGSGPYILEKWETGNQLTLKRNESYWGTKPPILRRVYKIITNPDAAFQVLAGGSLDSMSLTAEQWTTRANKESFTGKFNKFDYNASGYSYIGWNMRRPLFSDKRVRRALTMLLDRWTILEEVYYGLASITSGTFLMEEPEYNQAIRPWPFDPEAAARLLDEAGWRDSDKDGLRDKDGRAFKFEILLTPDNPTAEKIATMFQEELGAAGIEMTIRQLEWASLLQNVNELEFDAVMMGWGLVPYPDPYQLWHSSQAMKRGSNHVGFKNDEVDRILEQGRLEFERNKRVALYHRFHEILHEEQPYTFMFCRKSLLAVDKRFRNIKLYPYGPDAREWWVPKALQRYTEP